MRSVKELFYLGRDFWRVAGGKDYFHQRQGLGWFFSDPRCYYNDVSAKADWTGDFVEGVPVLYVPSWDTSIALPVMVLQYGLGNVDQFFRTRDRARLKAVEQVGRWIVRSILPEGYFDNRISSREPEFQFYSENSAMAQGQALSFCVRAVRYELLEKTLLRELADCIGRIIDNMLKPLEQNGTILERGERLYLCEYCRVDNYVVLNGWVFAIFGLYDYLAYHPAGKNVSAVLESTMATLERDLPSYILPDGWSRYDNKGRICSPFYHDLHISLIDALARLTRQPVFDATLGRLTSANGALNKVRYTFSKVIDRLKDRGLHTSQRQ